jgi:hypothetical protein
LLFWFLRVVVLASSQFRYLNQKSRTIFPEEGPLVPEEGTALCARALQLAKSPFPRRVAKGQLKGSRQEGHSGVKKNPPNYTA